MRPFNYIISGMKSMLKSGDANMDMDFFDLQEACGEPDLHEFEDLGEMDQFWEVAKTEYMRELVTGAKGK